MNRFQPVFDKQKAYFNTDATKSYAWRMDQLHRIANMLKENAEAFQEAVSKDFKTALAEKVFEVAAPLATIEFTQSQLQEWMKSVPAPVPKALAASGHSAVVIREPYGVSLIIGPSNGPLILLLHPAIAALSAGNTCILKLAEANPETSGLLLQLIPKYFEPEAVTAVTGSREEVTELLKLPFDFIFFTGSVPVGKVIMRAAAEHLTPVLLELGGQNPVFVDPSANLKDAAKKIVWGTTAWGGQWCTSPGYAYVHESVVTEFVAEGSVTKRLLGIPVPAPLCVQDVNRGEVAPWATCGHREGQSKAWPVAAGTWPGMGVDVECCTHVRTRFFSHRQEGADAQSLQPILWQEAGQYACGAVA
jgi:aldehyde dehydrogenase (NAD+)